MIMEEWFIYKEKSNTQSVDGIDYICKLKLPLMRANLESKFDVK